MSPWWWCLHNYDAVMRVATRAAIGALTVVAGLALSGCASNDTVTVTPPSESTASVPRSSDGRANVPDAKTLVHDARSAYRAARSAHLHATIDDNGDTQVIDIRGTMDGDNQELKVDDSAGGHATVRTVDGRYYINGDREFWAIAAKSMGSTARLLAGKWVLAPDSAAGDFKSITIRRLMDDMLGVDAITDADTERMTTYATTEQDTDLFVAVSVDPGSQDVNTLKVTAGDPHNVVEVSGTSSDGSDGSADFDGWNSQARIAVPKGYIGFPGGGDRSV